MEDIPDKIDAPPPSHNVAKVAQEGFGKNATAYDTLRPGYTEEAVELILKEMSAGPTSGSGNDVKYEVLELGAGTGKLTELVVPKLPTECRYLATEPSANFLACLKSKSLLVDTACVSASAIPLPDKSVRNVLCGQCLHWFSNQESLREMHRVLAPGGRLIAVWNMKDFQSGQWTGEFLKQRLEIMARTGSSTLNWVNTMEWKAALDASGVFSCARHQSLPGIDFTGTLDTMLSHFRTISCYNTLPTEECGAYLDALRLAILQYPDVDPLHMSFPFTSELYVFEPVQL